MKLLWLSHLVPYPPIGGVLQRSFHLLREAARRHEVHLIALNQSSQFDSDEDLQAALETLKQSCASVQIFPIPAEQSPLRWWSNVVLSFFASKPYDVNWLRSPRLRDRLASLSSEKVTLDLVHADTLGLVPYAEQLEGVPYVLNHHNIESQMMGDRAAQERNPFKRIYMAREAGKLGRWERSCAARAAVNTVVSPLDGERLQARVPEADIEIVENGVDVEYFSPRSSAEDHDGYLIFVGGMSWYPNRDAMQWFVGEIWPRLLEDDAGRRAVLIGRDPPPEVRRAASDGSIRAPGFVDDIRPTVDRALAYVCPIRKGGGTRLKVLDALAMGKPLVATTFAVEGLGLEAETHYLPAETPSDFVDQIRRLEDDASLRRRLGHTGRQFVEQRFAWEVVGENLERAYRRAISALP